MDDFANKMATVSWSFGDKDSNALAILEKRIADTGRDLKLVTYTDLVKGVDFRLPNINNRNPYQINTYDWSGLDRKIIGDFLGYASYRSYVKHGFMASALVVNRDEYRPSWHFFSWMKDLNVLPDLEESTVLAFWIDQVNKAHNWYKSNRRL
jgi:hypothetical protein